MVNYLAEERKKRTDDLFSGPGCSSGDLDLSTSLFSYLSDGNLDEGVFDIKWGYA